MCLQSQQGSVSSSCLLYPAPGSSFSTSVSQRWRRVSLLMLMPSCDQCDLKLLVGSAPFHISWINSPPGREPLPLWFSRWHHLQKSCPLKLEPSKYFTRGCWCQHVQPLKYVSYHVTAVFVAYTREAVKFVCFFWPIFKCLRSYFSQVEVYNPF